MKLQTLFETTYYIKPVVDYIYKETWKDFIDRLVYMYEHDIVPEHMRTPNPITLYLSEIERYAIPKISRIMRQNPVKIVAELSDHSYYSPLKKEIVISFNSSLYFYLKTKAAYNYTIREAIEQLDDNKKKSAINEIYGYKIRSTIAHELSHWLDDTEHNRHIKKMLNRYKKHSENPELIKHDLVKLKRKIIDQGQPDTYMTSYEVNALIHNIQQAKDEIGDKRWNKMKFDDVISYDSGVKTTFSRLNNILDKPTRDKFYKKFYQRLYRENLLGNNMKRTFFKALERL